MARTYYAFAAVAFLLALATFYLLAPPDRSSSFTSGEKRPLTLFDSAFWLRDSNSEPDFARLTEQTNPLTGEAYTADQVERIRELWRLFPSNSLLPRPAEDRFRKEKAEERMQNIARDLAAGSASESDLDTFYSARRREVEDRVQLVEHVLTETWPEEVMARYRGMREQDKRVLLDLDEERAAALSVLRIRKQD